MARWPSIFGAAAPAPEDALQLARGSREIPVEGEARHQDAIRAGLGGEHGSGHNLSVLALIEALDENRPTVSIGGSRVGYLAAPVMASLAPLARDAGAVRLLAPARINGGWTRDSGNRGYLTVSLLLTDPCRPAGTRPE